MCVARAAWWVRGWSSVEPRTLRVRRRLRAARTSLIAALDETQMELPLDYHPPCCSEKDAINPRAERGTEGDG